MIAKKIQYSTAQFLWILLIAYALATFIFPFLPITTFVYAGVIVVLGCIFALFHGTLRYGIRGMLIFILFCLIISNILENLSIKIGFPFGYYHYTSDLGPKLFSVPLLIGPAYFSTGYLSWVVSNVLLDKVDSKLQSLTIFALPFVASFIMVMWDVVMDPSSSTIKHLWIWDKGGGFFGVPVSNYLGWFLTVYLFFQAFALYLAKRPKLTYIKMSQSYWYQAVLFYFVIGLGYIASYLAGKPGTTVDATGAVWSLQGIRESSVILSLYTMCSVSVLALLRINKDKQD